MKGPILFKRIFKLDFQRGLTILFLLLNVNAYSLHVWGGELEANCDGNNNYTFRLSIYVDCGRVTGMPQFESIDIFNKSGILVRSINLSNIIRDTLPTVPNACSKTVVGTCIGRVVAEGIANLPVNTDGYVVSYSSCCRNSNIGNVTNPGATGQIYSIEIPGSNQIESCNSAPIFNALPPSEICTNLPVQIDFSATDDDGDQLKYKFFNPYGDLNGTFSGGAPFPEINFTFPYSFDNPMNSGLTINENTGIITGIPQESGLFALGVVVEEYRSGSLIGRKVRDFTYTIVPCDPLLKVGEPNISTCADEPVFFSFEFDGTLSSGTTPIWDFDDPSSLDNSSNLFNPNHKYATLGSYIATVIIEDSCGNSLKDSVKVEIIETIATVQEPGDFCKGEKVILNCSDNSCSFTEWFLEDTATIPVYLGCSYEFMLNEDSICIYYQPFVDPNNYTVGSIESEQWGTDLFNSTSFDAISPLTLDGFSVNGDQFWSGCLDFSAMVTIEQSGQVIAGPEFVTVKCDGEQVITGLNFDVPEGIGYQLNIFGASLIPAAGNPNSQVGLIDVYPGGPFYNIDVQSNLKCARRDSICIKSVCPCPDTTLKFPSSFCNNEEFNLETLKSDFTSPGLWTIKSRPNGSESAVINNDSIFDASGADAGIYTILYTLIGNHPGCIITNERNIEVYQIDSANIPNQGPFCKSGGIQTLFLDSTKTSLSGNWTSTNTGFISNTGDFDPSIADIGNYKVYYTTPSPICPVTDSVNLEVIDAISATILTPDTIICLDSDSFVIRKSIGTIEGGKWIGNIHLSDSLFNPKALGTFKVKYITSGINSSCNDSDSIIINVVSTDIVKIKQNQGPFCKLAGNQNLVIEGVTTSGGIWYSNILGAITPDGEFNPSVSDTGYHWVFHRSPGPLCPVKDSIQIKIVDVLDADILTKDTTICLNSTPFVIRKLTNGGVWINNGIEDSLFTPNSVGKFSVKYALTGLGIECSSVDSLEINVLPNPDATIVNPNPNEFCTWDTVITVLNKDTSGIGEWWSNPIGAISSTGLFDPSFGQLGEFEIFYGISGLCSDTNSTSVTIHSVKDPTIKSIPTLCEIANEEILEAVDVGVWSINGESSSGIFKAQNIGPGLHSITNSINDNCPVSDTLYIEVKENPISFFNSDTIEGCYPMLVNFKDLSDSNALTTQWTIREGNDIIFNTSQVNILQYIFENEGCYDISINSTYEYGCESSADLTHQICAYGPPSADFEFTKDNVSINDPIVYTANTSEDAMSFTWQFGQNRPLLNNNNELIVQYDIDQQDTVEISLIASNGWCEDTIKKSIIIWDFFTLYTPNAFTPNGDGINDIFLPTGRNHVGDDYLFIIYNRWGNRIFDTSVPYEGWDGTNENNREKCQEDVYVWKIILKDIFERKLIQKVGTVTLIK